MDLASLERLLPRQQFKAHRPDPGQDEVLLKCRKCGTRWVLEEVLAIGEIAGELEAHTERCK